LLLKTETKLQLPSLPKSLENQLMKVRVRSLKTCYLNALKSTGNESVSTLDHGNRGSPLHLGAIDRDVIDYVKKLRSAGGTVNKSIIIAAVTGIVKHKRPSLLRENGGGIEIGRGWAQNLYASYGLRETQGHKSRTSITSRYLSSKKRIFATCANAEVVQAENIPSELIINFDQTGCKFVPAAEWTVSGRSASGTNFWIGR
jgi:hypothetical protein